MSDTTPALRWRLLIVDDDRREAEHLVAVFAQELGEARLEAMIVDNKDDAERAIKERFVDAVILDDAIYSSPLGRDLDPHPYGQVLIRQLQTSAQTTRVVIYTKYLAGGTYLPYHKLVGIRHPDLLGVVDKRTAGSEQRVRDLLLPSIARWRESTELGVAGLDALADAIEAKRNRYPKDLLRSLPEIKIELIHLMRSLFVPPIPSGSATDPGRALTPRVELEPAGDPGLSPAVSYEARLYHPRSELPGGPPPEADAHLLLKVGPPRIIREEAQAFDAYVKFGVRLEHRVELLGVALANTMGVLCYSFAGGVHGDDMFSLDEVCKGAVSTTLGRATFDSLFGGTHRNWYGVRGRPIELLKYGQDELDLDIGRSLRETQDVWRKYERRTNEAFRQWALAALPVGVPPSVVRMRDLSGECEFSVSIADVNMRLPSVEFFAEGVVKYQEGPTSLIHGDLHSGNVLIEVVQLATGQGTDTTPVFRRACLIDYRSAGFGPRLWDIAQLQASIRFGHSRALRASDCDEIDALATAWRLERALVTDAVSALDAPPGQARLCDTNGEYWAVLAQNLDSLMGKSFSDVPERVTPEEYLLTTLLVGVRNLGNHAYESLDRARISVWVAAVFREYETLTGRTRQALEP